MYAFHCLRCVGHLSTWEKRKLPSMNVPSAVYENRVTISTAGGENHTVACHR